MQIEPQYTLPLVYQISDPADVTTYYIRAVVRNTLTGSTLNTINLVSQGAGRWTSSFLTPQDPTGRGLHIDVTIKVYTDSGYTTASDVYSQTNFNYLIKKSAATFGGGGMDIDYEKILEMFLKALKPKVAKKGEKAPLTLEDILPSLQAIQDSVDDIEIPEAQEIEPIDHTPVLDAIGGLKSHLTDHVSKSVDDIEFPEQEPVDFSPVIELLTKIGTALDDVSTLTTSHKEGLSGEIKTLVEAMKSERVAKNKVQWEKVKKFIGDVADGADFSEQPEEEGIPTPFQDFMKKR